MKSITSFDQDTYKVVDSLYKINFVQSLRDNRQYTHERTDYTLCCSAGSIVEAKTTQIVQYYCDHLLLLPETAATYKQLPYHQTIFIIHTILIIHQIIFQHNGKFSFHLRSHRDSYIYT